MDPSTKRRLQREILRAPGTASALAGLVGEAGVAHDAALRTALSRLPLIDRDLKAIATEAPLRCSVFGATFGLRAMRSDELARRVAQNGIYERHISAFFRQRLKPGEVFFDVGANVGYHSMLAARTVGPGGRVVAFEPHPAMRRLLTLNAVENRLPNITVDARALGLSNGSARIEVDLYDSGATAVARDGQAPAGSVGIEVVTIDQACMDHGVAPSYVKIDAEGLEADILMGGRRCSGNAARKLFRVRERSPKIVMEFCPANNIRAQTRFATALTRLQEVGYHACFFRGHDVAAFEPIPMAMLIELGDYWLARGHIGFVDVLLIKHEFAKKGPPSL